MIYVTSDLHGYPLEQFLRMLKRAGFGPADYLFVLGDVIDRGADGARLLRWLAAQPNAAMILGNHEAMLLSCDFLFESVTEQSLARLTAEKLELYSAWMANGGGPTLAGLRQILKEEPEVLEGILDYLRDAPLYDIVEAGGRMFFLVHAGLEHYEPGKELEDYAPQELLWARPGADTRYQEAGTVIFGHTPTEYFGEEYRGRPVKGDGWICIDTGAAGGGKPMLLRLDDMKVFL